MMTKSTSSSLMKDSVTFTTDFVRRPPSDNINISVEPPGEPLASCGAYTPGVTTRTCLVDLLPATPHPPCERIVRPPSPPNSHDASTETKEIKPVMCRAVWARSSAIILAYHK